jgi:hypothetical protein
VGSGITGVVASTTGSVLSVAPLDVGVVTTAGSATVGAAV